MQIILVIYWSQSNIKGTARRISKYGQFEYVCQLATLDDIQEKVRKMQKIVHFFSIKFRILKMQMQIYSSQK